MSGSSSNIAHFDELFLDAGALNWRMGTRDNGDTEYAVAKAAVTKRDMGFCRYCGFRSASEFKSPNSGIEVHFLNGDGNDFNHSNMVTCCNLCKQCFNLSYAGAEQKAILAYIPEFNQAFLNNILRSIMCIQGVIQTRRARLIEEGDKNPDETEEIKALSVPLVTANALFAAIKERSKAAENILGSSKAEELGQAIEALKKQESASAITRKGLEIQISESTKDGQIDSSKQKALDLENNNTPLRARLDLALSGIRLVATQPGCDPRTWVPPTGSYLTSLPRNWVQMFTRHSEAISEFLAKSDKA